MTFPKARAIVAACLFLGWLGFLLFLVLERKSVVLSTPQFLIAEAIVVAELPDAEDLANRRLGVKEILWPKDLRLPNLELPELRDYGSAKGYHGAGLYLLPLMKRNDRYVIAPRPTFDKGSMPWIYPWTPETQAQVEQIIAAKDRE